MSLSLSDTPPVLSDRVRRLIYQASYTGMKETDLLLGHFAKSYLADLSDDDLTDFENLLAAGDHWIYAWLTENEAVPDAPPHFQSPTHRSNGHQRRVNFQNQSNHHHSSQPNRIWQNAQAKDPFPSCRYSLPDKSAAAPDPTIQVA